jgi:aryl-alcohol dehydrogenase-like predicted oxidoreductase
LKKKIILGTANFSGTYGIFNKELKKDINIKKILNFFNKNKLHKIDLSPHYFNLKKNEEIFKDFKIIYKILLKKNLEISEFKKEIKFSKNFIKNNEIYCLMFHNTEMIKNKVKIIKLINYIKKNFKIKKIGISVYTPMEVKRVMKYFQPDLIQFPINIFDQTFLKNKFLYQLSRKGIELHARSIFLQGLLLQNKYPQFLHKNIKNHWKRWSNWLNKNNISPLVACLSFINKIRILDGVIIGVDNLKQLKLILNLRVKKLNFNKLAINNKKIIYPQNWLQE